ncbi:hypothetical protein MSAS_15610 [Mycobacterium saskatchewanense]|uniref:AMP-binding enzyme C-terminal domain-containing protein n=1 Tax=Mycobacterium saskatchewanense TaxID=220927 RepID=A0AAJ3NTG6_9MYCO|nr:hypothetical protein AWC23_07820 [Mycobacterium saskatchewanense]BBX62387.1 hypothetical protein MSAS_15610 [Mycobacterium saskatchewanense]
MFPGVHALSAPERPAVIMAESGRVPTFVELEHHSALFASAIREMVVHRGDGVNIYPQEIENVLALHPKMSDVAVIRAPDPDMGERAKAVVQLRGGLGGSDELATELMAHVCRSIAHHKTPRSVGFVDELHDWQPADLPNGF